MMPTIELCEGCQKEYHKAYLTDDGARLCSACYIELLKSELSRLEGENKTLKEKHHSDCNVLIPMSQEMPEPPYCTCGYGQLEAQVAKLREIERLARLVIEHGEPELLEELEEALNA